MTRGDNVKLGGVCDVRDGTHESPKYVLQGYPLVTSKNLTNGHIDISSANYISKDDFLKINCRSCVDDGDILMPMIGTIGNPIIVAKTYDFAIKNVALIKFKEVKNVSNKYILYLLSSTLFLNYIEKENRGGTQKFLSLNIIRAFPFFLPPLDEQKRIADVLDKASELIKKRKEQIRLMDELAKSLFIEMFGDPVENPMGWDVKLLDELGKFKNGINFGQKDTGYVVKFLGVGDFKSQNVFDNIDSLSSVKLTEKPNPEYFLNDGDIVFVRSNGSKELVGRNIIIYPRGKLVTFSGFCIRFRVLSNHILPEYLQNLLLIPSLKSRLLENGRGCNIQNLNQQMLSSINIPLPPLELQKAFVNRIDAIEQQKALLQNGLAKMETAYKALMQEYFG